MLNVLLIEDDKDLAPLIKEYLHFENIHCTIDRKGTDGLQYAKEQKDLDCIILDLNLPALDGVSICKNLRRNNILTPIIMLTARDKLDDKLMGFEVGANDYLCKPFEMKELVARIKALTSRLLYDDKLICADLVVNVATKTARRGDRLLELTQIEFAILTCLLLNSPKVVPKQKILDKVWGDEPPESDSLKVHMHNLRRAVDSGANLKLIHTVPGHGYGVYVK